MIVGVFGGTFDPPHLGHLGLARAVLGSALVGQVWFIPCLAHPFRKAPAAFAHRVEMCRLLIAGERDMRVSTIEEELEEPGYTLDLVKALRGKYPEDRFRLVAGADIYHERDQWYRYDEVARLAPPIYVARVGVPPIPEPALEAPVEASSAGLRAALGRGERPLDKLPIALLEYIEAHRLYRAPDR